MSKKPFEGEKKFFVTGNEVIAWAALAGARAFTATSGPGNVLMQGLNCTQGYLI